MTYRDLDPTQALTELRADPELRVLDVRTQPEYDLYHIEKAVLLPIQELQERIAELDPTQAWVVTCEHGVRSQAACEFLSQIGFTDLRNVQGGMARWVAEQVSLTP